MPTIVRTFYGDVALTERGDRPLVLSDVADMAAVLGTVLDARWRDDRDPFTLPYWDRLDRPREVRVTLVTPQNEG